MEALFDQKIVLDSIERNAVSVKWEFVDLYLDGGPRTSSSFTLPSDGYLIPFCLLVTDRSKSDIEFKLKLRKSIQTQGRAIVTLSIKCEGTPDFVRTRLIEEWNEDYTFDSFCPTRESRKSSTTLLSAVVHCSITWLGFSQQPNIQRVSYPKELCLPKLPYDNKLMPDVRIIIGSEEFPAHKNVLTLHSPVFLGMFETPMREAKENRVIIEDIEFPTMDTLLKIIYSGETDELSDVEMALKILAAAEKYQMVMIKRACEYKLSLSVNKDNVLKLLDTAEKYHVEQLCQTCVRYIIAHGKILPSEKFEEMCLKSSNLAKAVIRTQMQRLYGFS